MAGATQWYIRTALTRSSALLQREQLAVVAQQGDGLVSNFLREDATLWFSDGVTDRRHVHEARTIQAERGFGVKDLAHGIIEAIATDLATLDGTHYRVERDLKIGGD